MGSLDGGGKQLRSQRLLCHMKRLKCTKKESNVSLLEREGLQADCKISNIEVGLKKPHPILAVSDMLGTLSSSGKLGWLTGGQGFTGVRRFWVKFREEQPSHPVFDVHPTHLERCIPIYVYGDEGTSHKKAAFLVQNWQPVLGKGTSYSVQRPGASSQLGCNMLGVSYTTRFVYTCMQARLYSKKPKVFTKIMESFAEELHGLFHDGVEVQHDGELVRIFPTVIACKGDWPMLKKMGNLTRTHHGSKAEPGNGKGVCHLCMAGTAHHPDWHNIYNGSWKGSDVELLPPWRVRSPFTALIPQPPNLFDEVWFYRPDLFHTMHKGVMAELAGSCIATQIYFSCMSCKHILYVFLFLPQTAHPKKNHCLLDWRRCIPTPGEHAGPWHWGHYPGGCDGKASSSLSHDQGVLQREAHTSSHVKPYADNVGIHS